MVLFYINKKCKKKKKKKQPKSSFLPYLTYSNMLP